jgi:hypothetical protein
METIGFKALEERVGTVETGVAGKQDKIAARTGTEDRLLLAPSALGGSPETKAAADFQGAIPALTGRFLTPPAEAGGNPGSETPYADGIAMSATDTSTIKANLDATLVEIDDESAEPDLVSDGTYPAGEFGREIFKNVKYLFNTAGAPSNWPQVSLDTNGMWPICYVTAAFVGYIELISNKISTDIRRWSRIYIHASEGIIRQEVIYPGVQVDYYYDTQIAGDRIYLFIHRQGGGQTYGGAIYPHAFSGSPSSVVRNPIQSVSPTAIPLMGT